MRGAPALLATFAAAAVLAGCATADDPRYAREVPLIGTSGQQVGTVSAWETRGAVSLRIRAAGLPHGLKGLHVHAVGRCDPPGFDSAGSHWNPTAQKHGLNNAQGPHAGDLPNISIAANGVVSQAVVLSGASLAALADADGSALVIHASADDYVTDPSGNSGARIACAIIAPALQ